MFKELWLVRNRNSWIMTTKIVLPHLIFTFYSSPSDWYTVTVTCRGIFIFYFFLFGVAFWTTYISLSLLDFSSLTLIPIMPQPPGMGSSSLWCSAEEEEERAVTEERFHLSSAGTPSRRSSCRCFWSRRRESSDLGSCFLNRFDDLLVFSLVFFFLKLCTFSLANIHKILRI